MELNAEVLENRFVRLEPLGEAHKEGLQAATNRDADFFPAFYPYSWAGEHFDATWAKTLKDIGKGHTIAYAVTVDGVCRGISTYYGIDREQAVLEIGGTFYEPSVRGGPVNPSCKRLMMAHAFDSGARRVVYRVDAINLRSRAAVLKLGAVQEGVLRQDRQTFTGRVRDTVIFSILADEWPAVRDRLDARIAAFG